MADPFITTQDLTDYLGRDVTADGGATFAVEAACEVARDVAEQTFSAATSTVTLDGTGTDCLLLPELPASTAGTVNVNGTAVTDYVLADNGRLIRTSGTLGYSLNPDCAPYWPEGRQNVEVTYDHGAGTVPAAVRMVALSLAARLVVQGVALSETVGDVSVRYAGAATDLTNTERLILQKHRPIR